MVEVGKRIHEKRTECQLTMEELGRQLGVSKSTINKWEKGMVKSIERPYVEAMSKIFCCDPAWLMNFHDSDEVYLTYSAEGKEPVTLKAKGKPIIGETSLRAQIYEAAAQVRPENLQAALTVLKSLQ